MTESPRIRTQLTLVIALFAPSLLPACDVGPEVESDVITRDSLGVRIVENPATVRTATYLVAAEPDLVVGVASGAPEYEFNFVTGARRLSDGRIAVVNLGTQEIRLYAADGSHLRNLGGSGDGPGEFRSIADLVVLPGDTLLAWDGSRQSRVWFAPDGELARTDRLENAPWVSQFAPDRVARPSAILPDGGFVISIRADAQYPPGPRRAFLGLAWSEGGDQAAELLGEYGGPDEFNFGDRSRGIFHPMPFRRSTYFAVGGNPPRIFVGGMRNGVEGIEIDAFAADGRKELIVRFARPPQEVPSQVRDSILSQERSLLESRIAPDLIASFEANVGNSYPPHGPLYVDSEGYLWVEEQPISREAPRSHLIFDPDGRVVARADTPPGLRILDIGEDYVLGVGMDSLNVEFVQLYELSRN